MGEHGTIQVAIGMFGPHNEGSVLLMNGREHWRVHRVVSSSEAELRLMTAWEFRRWRAGCRVVRARRAVISLAWSAWFALEDGATWVIRRARAQEDDRG